MYLFCGTNNILNETAYSIKIVEAKAFSICDVTLSRSFIYIGTAFLYINTPM